MNNKYILLAYNTYIIKGKYNRTLALNEIALYKDINNKLYFLDICSDKSDSCLDNDQNNCIRQPISDEFAEAIFGILENPIKWR